MINLSIQSTKDWFVSYNPYTDILQIYKKAVMTTDRSELEKTKFSSGSTLTYKKDDSTYLVELENAYDKFGSIDNMDKNDIIEKVKGYVSHHG